jgi:hypothetical protein
VYVVCHANVTPRIMLYGVCVGMERRRRCGWPHGTRTMKMWCTPVRHASISTACPDASSSPCGAYCGRAQGWMALNSTCVLRRRRRTTASGKLGACDTRSAASCAVYAAGCMLCVLSVACCNCVLQRRRRRLPVESVGPTTRAAQARLHVQAGGDGRNGCAHPIDIPILSPSLSVPHTRKGHSVAAED